jgi:hypothetical protein
VTRISNFSLVDDPAGIRENCDIDSYGIRIDLAFSGWIAWVVSSFWRER